MKGMKRIKKSRDDKNPTYVCETKTNRSYESLYVAKPTVICSTGKVILFFIHLITMPSYF